MKTAISIPEDVFREAQAFAKQQNMNRSEVFVLAMRNFLKQQKQHAALLVGALLAAPCL